MESPVLMKQSDIQNLRSVIIRNSEECLGHIERASSGNLHQAIHELRKTFKKIRAILRLTRDTNKAKSNYKDENRLYRDWGRQISDLRDASAKIELLDKLYQRQESNLYKNTFNQIKQELERQRKELVDQQVAGENRLERIREEINEHLKVVNQLPLNDIPPADIMTSLQRVYKRGAKGLNRSTQTEAMEDFHEWRKRVKYLRYQLLLIAEIWPPVIRVMENELHRLSDDLGDLHDLYLLFHTLSENKMSAGDQTEIDLLSALIKQEQTKLIRAVICRGKKFFVSSPKNWTRMLTVWETVHSEMEQVNNSAVDSEN